MESPLQHSGNRRRWLMPIVVLLVGGGIAIWASQNETRRLEVVRQQITGIVHRVCAGQDVTTTLRTPTPELQAEVIKALHKLCADQRQGTALNVDVAPGDLENVGSFQGTATHVATVTSAGGRSLILRINDTRAADQITVVGFIRGSATGSDKAW